jgi:hypothetical protein
MLPTSRIKTVRAGARDCPQDNPLSKRARCFDLRQVLALFLYIVANSIFDKFWQVFQFVLKTGSDGYGSSSKNIRSRNIFR